MTSEERRRRLKVARLQRMQVIAMRHAARRSTSATGGSGQTTVATTGAGTSTTGQRS